MDTPELVEDRLGDESLRRGVMIGDEDVVCITPTRTLLYRAEGLLSDESVEEFPHDVERLALSEGRRKTKFVLEYVEETTSLTVSADIARDVLGLLLEGILLTSRILDDGEAVVGAFRFSELTLVICDRRVVKHVGSAVWDDDYEGFAFADLDGLAFEEASVATEVVLEIDGRPQRIKTPNDQARVVEETLKQAVFDYFDVARMAELESLIEDGDEDEDEGEEAEELGLESGIDPLVDDEPTGGPFEETGAGGFETKAGGGPPDDLTEETDAGTAMPTGEETVGDPVTREDLQAVTDQLAELTDAVDRQNQLLRNQNQTLQNHQERLQTQGRAIRQLIEELRQGR